jgi:xylose dehydrogenase (NAD/NADP)
VSVSPGDPVRIGVLGAARIARLFVDSVRPSRRVVVTAVASRDVERASAFARETGVARVLAAALARLAAVGG